jgi:peptidylprolyl isomerase
VPPTKLLAAFAAASLLFVACGDDDTDATDTSADVGTATQGIDGVTVEGQVGESATITVDPDLEVTDLVTEDLVVGDGEAVPEGATVTVHYAGVLLDGTEFDASFGGQPATFPLSGVIPGWTQGIPGMKVGGRRLLVIPPELAYGSSGQGPIPPNAPLVFVVDMLDVS